MTQGILMIAAGNPFYGNSAFYAALSIKHAEPEAKICLAFEPSAIAHLNDVELSFFDELVEMEDYRYTEKGKKDYMKPKLHAFDLSPWDRTFLIDVDTVWNPKKKPSELFEELQNCDFTIISEGWCDVLGDGPLNPKYTFWADREDIVNRFMDQPGFLQGRIYQFRSEFIYWERNERTKLFFYKAVEVRSMIDFEVKNLGGNVPDELCFDIAGAITHTYPHQDKWTPIHWYWFHGRPYEAAKSKILADFYAISLGGFKAPSEVLIWTKAMLRKAADAAGVTLRHKFGTKTGIIPERKSL